MRLRSSFVFYALVDIAIRFFDTDLSLLIRLSVIEVQRKEVVTVTGLRYSCKTLKTSKVNDIINLMKRDKLTPYVDHRLQRINAGEKIITYRKGPPKFRK